MRRQLPWIGVVVCAALVAAVCAHVLIDVLGDYLISDDAYDHVAHGSRLVLTALAALGAFSGGLRAFSYVCNLAATAHLQHVLAAKSYRFGLRLAAGISALTLLVVPIMEWADAAIAGDDDLSIASAFGGSLVLGIGSSLVCAAIIAALVFGAIRWLCARRECIVVLVRRLLVPRPRREPLFQHFRQHAVTAACRNVHVTQHSKRGPPRVPFVTAPSPLAST